MMGSYCPVLETPENQHFLRLTKAAGQYPAENNFVGWLAAQTMWEALRSIGGRAEDRDGLVTALRQVQFKGPMGSFRYDWWGNPTVDFFMQEVKRVGGEFHNVCIEKIPEVGHPDDIPFPPK